MHAVAHMVKIGMLLLIITMENVKLDVMIQMVKSGTIQLKNANATSLEKSGKMALVSKCVTHPLVRNSEHQLIHVSAQHTNNGMQALTLVTITVLKAESGTTGMINASAHTEKPSATGLTCARTSVHQAKSGTHGTISASAQDGEKFSTHSMIPAAAQMENSGILTGNGVSAHSENTGTTGMTHASGMCSVTTLTLCARKPTTTKMSTVSVSNGLVKPSEKESMNSSEKSKSLLHNGMTPLDQSLMLMMLSGTGNGEKTRDRESNVRNKLSKSMKERTLSMRRSKF